VLLVSLAAARFDPVHLIGLGLVISTSGLAAMTMAATPSLLLAGMVATGAHLDPGTRLGRLRSFPSTAAASRSG
jgi:hypothetical protein